MQSDSATTAGFDNGLKTRHSGPRADPPHSGGRISQAAELAYKLMRTATIECLICLPPRPRQFHDLWLLAAELRQRGIDLLAFHPARDGDDTADRADGADLPPDLVIRLAPHVTMPIIVADRRASLIWPGADPEIVMPIDGPAFASTLAGLIAIRSPASPADSADVEAPTFLTDRNLLLIRLMSRGMKDEQASRVMGISPRSYRRDYADLARKLGAKSRPHFITITESLGLTSPRAPAGDSAVPPGFKWLRSGQSAGH